MNTGVRYAPLGYNQITTLSAAVGLGDGLTNDEIPAGANFAIVTAEAQAVRWRDDGTAPSGTVGMPLASGGTLEYTGNLAAVKVIESASGAKLNVNFYRISG